MRVIPRMVVISPCDAIEAKKATIAAAKTNTPVYIRLAREKTPVMTTTETPFEIGKAQIFWDPPAGGNPQVTIIASGALVYKALLAAQQLENPPAGGEGIGSIVINLSTIKPLDEETILEAVKRAPNVVTVEEHQVNGGMGSAVAEFLSQNFPVPQEFIGVHDQFGQSGTPEELIEHYNMGEKGIIEAVKKVLTRK